MFRELHKEVVAGIDEAMARHAQETDKVDLLTLKKLKARVNALEQQVVTDKAKQLTVSLTLTALGCLAFPPLDQIDQLTWLMKALWEQHKGEALRSCVAGGCLMTCAQRQFNG